MFMDILQREGVGIAFLGIKAYRNPLDNAYVVYRRLLIKVSQGDLMLVMIDINGRNGRRDLLHQSQP
jgi:hypothetical protein